jgi:hypothetical protein
MNDPLLDSALSLKWSLTCGSQNDRCIRAKAERLCGAAACHGNLKVVRAADERDKFARLNFRVGAPDSDDAVLPN